MSHRCGHEVIFGRYLSKWCSAHHPCCAMFVFPDVQSVKLDELCKVLRRKLDTTYTLGICSLEYFNVFVIASFILDSSTVMVQGWRHQLIFTGGVQ